MERSSEQGRGAGEERAWWEGDAGPSVWDGAAPEEAWARQLHSYPEGEPFEANTRLPFVWPAITSVILGVIGLVFCHLLFGGLAIGYGISARRKVKAAPKGTRRGDEWAVAGIAIGATAIGIGVLRIVFGVALLW